MDAERVNRTVRFYLEPGVAGDVLAVFEPDEPSRYHECYARAVRYSTCSDEYAAGLRRASPRQWAALAKELSAMGHSLTVV